MIVFMNDASLMTDDLEIVLLVYKYTEGFMMLNFKGILNILLNPQG